MKEIRKTYYANGALKEKATYVNGLREGPTYIYYENGQLLEESNYKNGRIEGTPVVHYRSQRVRLAVRMKKGVTKSGCYVATAAMGDYGHPYVVELRLFRDQLLLKTYAGRAFVSLYYRVGPVLARIIEKSVILRKITLATLIYPAVIMSVKLRKFLKKEK